MPRQRRNPRIETVYGKCGHLCSVVPRFLDMVVCDYCTRDAVQRDPGHDEVWVEIRRKETVVMRRLPKPRIDKRAPGKTQPLFDVDPGNGGNRSVSPFSVRHQKIDGNPDDVPF